MNKRHFLGTAALAGLLPAVDALAADPARKGPGLLTVSGLIGKSNRGPVDPALDQLLVKHGARPTDRNRAGKSVTASAAGDWVLDLLRAG